MPSVFGSLQKACSYLTCFRENVEIDGKRYVVRDQLGEGGFSTVLLVTEVGTNRLYALKKIRCHSKEDEKLALTEIEYHRKIRNHCLIECLGSAVIGKADITDNAVSLVMILLPYFKHGTLHHHLESRAKTRNYYTEPQILNYFRQICEGVKAIHSAGAAHRDLKPGNVLLGANDKVVIMDFGSMGPAKVEITNYAEAQRLQDEAAERCSMTYRAPELFNVQNPTTIDQRIDIWSLGCLLYALCFFKSPFDEVYEKGNSVALAVASGVSSFPNHSANFSEKLLGLISMLLVCDPQQRPFIEQVIDSVETFNQSRN